MRPLWDEETLEYSEGGGGIISAPTTAYQGPGDIVSGATAWWGLRAYSAANIGTAIIRIRDTTANVESDFNAISTGLVDTVGIATFLGGHGGIIVKYYDQSSNGRTLTPVIDN